MHKLEEQISNWRHELASRESILPENIAELEDHLRTIVENFQEKGLTEEEAFLVAARRLGPTDQLSQEFGKVNIGLIWLQRVRWMIYGLLIYQLLIGGWNLLAESAGAVTIFYSNSPVFGSALFIALASSLPIGILLGIRLFAQNKIGSQKHWLKILRPAVKKPNIIVWGTVGFLVLLPILQFSTKSIAFAVIPIEKMASFATSRAVYEIVAAILLPLIWLLILKSLESFPRKTLPTNGRKA